MVQPGGGQARSIAATPILVVDGADQDAARLLSCLSEIGVPEAAVTWVATLSEALRALDSGPRCVLLAMNLPDADGPEAVRKIIDAAPTVAVIALTDGDERDGVEAVAAGAQDHFAKSSLSGELLERSIRYAAERRRTQRTQQQLREVRMSATEKARLERGLLPTPLLQGSRVSCSTYYRPGRDYAILGGDFFDVIDTGDGRVRAVIGDVMGHGPDEAALGVHLRVAWRTLLLAGTPEEQVLPTLARMLDAEPDVHRRYATVCDVTIDADGAAVRSAGHLAPIICVDGACSYADVAIGAPLGVHVPGSPATSWPATRLATPSGTSILLYTDGLLDAFAEEADPDGIGIDELVAAVGRTLRRAEAAPNWISRLLEDAPGESVDDTAVVVLTIG